MLLMNAHNLHFLRIEELEGAIASTLRVNKLLNAEVETYLSTADR